MKTSYTFDVDLYSDLYNDAYGHRPKGREWTDWVTADDDEKQKMWDQLLIDLDLALKVEHEPAWYTCTIRDLVNER